MADTPRGRGSGSVASSSGRAIRVVAAAALACIVAAAAAWHALRARERRRALVSSVRGGDSPRHPQHFRAHEVITPHTLLFGVEFGDADYDGFFEHHLFAARRGAYPVSIVADAFFHCGRGLHLVSREYSRTPAARNLSEMRVEVSEGGAWRDLGPGAWSVMGPYESTAVGIWRDARVSRALCAPGGAPPPALPFRVTFAPHNWAALHFEGTRTGPNAQALPLPPPRSATATWALSAGARAPPPSRVAMCAVFGPNPYLLRLWTSYWALLGVETFYLFYNGAAGDIPALNASLAGLRAGVQWVHWPMLHWVITDAQDITHGQPVAIVDCLERWRDAHEVMLFYDLDEYLVLPRHDSIPHFLDAYGAADLGRGPLIALRTQSAWSMVNLSAAGAGVTIADIDLAHLATLPVMRGAPGGREKFWLNASAVEPAGGCGAAAPPERQFAPTCPVGGALIHNLNLHGVYHAQSHEGAHVAILRADGGAFPAYHLHVLNTASREERVTDGRHLFMPAVPVQDAEVGDLIRRALARRRGTRPLAR